MLKSSEKIKVIHFQRKPRPGFNYSIESIFRDLRERLKDRINFSVKICSRFNDGYVSKIYNIIEAGCRQKKNAVSHITGELHFLNLFMRKKNTLLTIHDCRFMERKKGFEKKIMNRMYLKAPVKKSMYVTTVSENSKRDIINYTNCAPEKIQVIPVSVSPVFKPSNKTFNSEKPVLLQIGTAPNKNLSRLIAALNEIKIKLVIIGSPDQAQINQLNNNSIDYTSRSNLSIEELYYEYINCDIVSFISTFEGFGMPIVEANCVERAVVTSNISSMPEIAGNAACLVDPYNITEIRNSILKLINDKAYREQLIENGRINKLRFNAQAIAESYYVLYKKIAEGLAV